MNTALAPTKSPLSASKEKSLDDLWDIYIKLKGELAPSSRLKFFYMGRRFCDFVRDKPLTTDTILQWVTHLQNAGTMKPHRINWINQRIRMFLKWLRTIGLVQERLYEVIPKLNAPALKEPQIFTEEEYHKIKKFCTGREWCQTHLWLIILAYRTGMSLVDCCHLRWRDVHLNDDGPSYMEIHRIKTARLGPKSKCHIPLVPGSDIYKWLLFLRDNTERYKRFDGIDDYVRQDAPGIYMWYGGQNLPLEFKKIFQFAGVAPGKTFRNFRNSLCSNLVNSGMAIPLVCQITGHNSVEMLMRYLKPDAGALQDGMAKSYQYSASQDKTGLEVDGLRAEDAEKEVTV